MATGSARRDPATGGRRRAPLVAKRSGSAADTNGRGASGRGASGGPRASRAPAGKGIQAPAPPPSRPPGLDDTDGAWLSPRQAADAAGVSMAAIRRWRKAGTIADRAKPDAPGQIEVFLAADRHRSTNGPSPAPDSRADGLATPLLPHSELGVLVPLEIHQRSLAELILRLTDTTERAVRAEAEVKFLRQRLAQLGEPD